MEKYQTGIAVSTNGKDTEIFCMATDFQREYYEKRTMKGINTLNYYTKV